MVVFKIFFFLTFIALMNTPCRGEVTPSLFFPTPSNFLFKEEGEQNSLHSSLILTGIVMKGETWSIWLNERKISSSCPEHPEFEILSVTPKTVEVKHKASGQFFTLIPGKTVYLPAS